MTAPAIILVVDDEPISRMLFAVSLEEAGYQVEQAADGQQALDILRNQPIDVLLLDLLMPELDGFEVLEIMQADADLREVPVIITSAVDDMDDVVRCLEAGATDYLSKPFEPLLLYVRVRAALALRQLRRMHPGDPAP